MRDIRECIEALIPILLKCLVYDFYINVDDFYVNVEHCNYLQ